MTKCKPWKVAILMSLALLGETLLAIPAYASEAESRNLSTAVAYMADAGGSISPYYVALTRLSATLSIDSGRADCGGTATAALSYTCDVTLELQQKIGSNWETIKEWTSSGRSNSFNKSWYVNSGYDYQVKITAEVYNSAGKLMESPVVYSSIVHY